jgi:hypothetical protein
MKYALDPIGNSRFLRKETQAAAFWPKIRKVSQHRNAARNTDAILFKCTHLATVVTVGLTLRDPKPTQSATATTKVTPTKAQINCDMIPLTPMNTLITN